MKIKITNDKHDLDQLRMEAAKTIASENGINLEEALTSIKNLEAKGLVKFVLKNRKVEMTRPSPAPLLSGLAPRTFLVIALVMASVILIKGREIHRALQNESRPDEDVIKNLDLNIKKFICHDPQSEACVEYQKFAKDLKDRLDEGK